MKLICRCEMPVSSGNVELAAATYAAPLFEQLAELSVLGPQVRCDHTGLQA